MAKRETLKPLQISLVRRVVKTQVECECSNRSVFQPVSVSAFTVPGSEFRKAVSLSEKQEDVDRYKEMKREKTHRDRTGCVWSAEDFLLSGSQKFSRIQCRPSQKKKKMQPLLIESAVILWE